MIPYIGIDAVEIDRFQQFHQYHRQQLARIFTPDELEACYADPRMMASRCATRFAAKEALYKALSQYMTPPPFLYLCRTVTIMTTPAPVLHIPEHPELHASISLTHTATTAIAVVLLWRPTQ